MASNASDRDNLAEIQSLDLVWDDATNLPHVVAVVRNLGRLPEGTPGFSEVKTVRFVMTDIVAQHARNLTELTKEPTHERLPDRQVNPNRPIAAGSTPSTQELSEEDRKDSSEQRRLQQQHQHDLKQDEGKGKYDKKK